MEREVIISKLEEFRQAYITILNFKRVINEYTFTPRSADEIKHFFAENLSHIYKDKEPVKEFCIGLLRNKSRINNENFITFVQNSEVPRLNQRILEDYGKEIVGLVMGYVAEMNDKLNESTLVDKAERSVFVRKAIARFMTFASSVEKVDLITDWSEYTVSEYISYIDREIPELIEDTLSRNIWFAIDSTSRVDRCFITKGEKEETYIENMLKSIETYLDYIDSFLKY